jgi:predicted hotdog family 3-hydroxylacyl-ACP dehydratase
MNNLQNPIVNSDTILDYIPQREPMVLISRIYKCDERSIVTGFDITDSHILNQNNKLTESGIIENMAQTAASMAGFVAVKNGTKPVLGFIGNIKNLVINFLPPSGNELYTEVITKTQVMNVSIIEANSYSNNELVATCEMKIFLQENA